MKAGFAISGSEQAIFGYLIALGQQGIFVKKNEEDN